MKRKRVFYYDDSEPALKKVKLLDDDDKQTFLKEKTYQTYNMKEYRFEERKFGDISEEDDPFILFQENKMKEIQDQLQFQQYYMKNSNEFNAIVPQPPHTDSPPKIYPKPKYSFSDYSKHSVEPGELIRELFGKDRDEECDWNIGIGFQPGKEQVLSKAIFNVWNETRLVYYGNHSTGDESNRRIYINDFLKLVLRDLKGGAEKSKYGKVKIKSEERVKKSGEVDVGGYVFVRDTQVLLIVEAKKGDIEAGLSQTIMEMRSSCQRNPVELDYVYGFVTNAKEWKPVRMNWNRRIVEEGTTCTISDAYSNKKKMIREIEEVVFVLLEMLKKGVEDYISKTTIQ